MERGAATDEDESVRYRRQTFADELSRGLPSTLTFPEYLACAIEESRRGVHGQRGWQSPLFYLIRLIKAHPQFSKATAQQAIRATEDILRAWRPFIPKERLWMGDWGYWLHLGREDAHAEFLDAWDKVRYLPGSSPLANAYYQAKRFPLRLAADTKQRRTEVYEFFISIAGWLQVAMGDRNILLPVEELSEILHVEPMTISRYRKWAIEDGFLKEVQPHAFKGKGKGGKATEFRFDVSRVPILMERAQRGTTLSFGNN